MSRQIDLKIDTAAMLEWRIDNARLKLQYGTEKQKKAAWNELRDLIGQRSPERVAAMEKVMGLTR